jgi:hypothetical protein
MKKISTAFIHYFRNKSKHFPDKREGKNTSITMEDIVLSAFAVFHMQSPSFLQFQTNMMTKEGKSNAQSLFDIEKTPSDNHIRDILDNVEPRYLQPLYNRQLKYLKDAGVLNRYRYMQRYPVALDGTQYYSSEKICCTKCLTRVHNNTTHYLHQAVTPIIVSPFHKEIIPLMPEFIQNSDGKEKQDCEINASKRWIHKERSLMLPLLFLGDDLYAHEPFCRDIINKGDSFVFVAKEESHKIMYEHIDFIERAAGLEVFSQVVGRAHNKEVWEYRFINSVHINGSKDALMVNWLELKVTTGKKRYSGAFISDIDITRFNIHDIGLIGRSRWKIENENNNVLKTKGYHLEHNFGHGKDNLSEFLLALNILAFLFHTVLGILDENYAKAKAKVPTQRFFQDMETLTSFIYFSSWDILIAFMARDRDSPMVSISDLMDISKLRE